MGVTQMSLKQAVAATAAAFPTAGPAGPTLGWALCTLTVPGVCQRVPGMYSPSPPPAPLEQHRSSPEHPVLPGRACS